MNNIIVTGGLGILGREVVDQLLKNKNNFVILIDKEKSKKKIKTFSSTLKKIKFLNLDFTNINCFSSWCSYTGLRSV